MKQTLPFYFQSASHDCVPACVMAIADFYRVTLTLNEIRDVLVTDPAKGTVIKHMQNLQSHFQITLGRITDLTQVSEYLPFIAYVNQQHAVVVWGEADPRAHTYQVGDPAVGLVTMTLQELLLIWDGVSAVLRPREGVELAPLLVGRRFRWWDFRSALSWDRLQVLQLSWWMMGWESLIVSVVGALNIAYSLYYVQFLPDFGKFVLFMASYGVLSFVLTVVGSVVRMRIVLHYERLLGLRLEDASQHINLRFYTLGDVSTRFSDALAVISSMMGLFRDIPYSLVVFAGSLYFLIRQNCLLALFTVSFLVLLMVCLLPFVRVIQKMVYKIRLKQGELSNRIMSWLAGGNSEVNTAWNELIGLQYRQGIRSIPISAIIGNSVVLAILFVVIFLHWKEGNAYAANTTGYQQILTAIMIMNYAVSAGHNLYGRIVGWQMALPSLHRLSDFLTVDRVSFDRSALALEAAVGQEVSG